MIYTAVQAEALFFGGGTTWFGLPSLAVLLLAAATPSGGRDSAEPVGQGIHAMRRSDGFVFATGLTGYGLVCLAFGDFGLQWQPVPDWVTGRQPLAWLNGALLATGGALLFWPRSALATARGLALYLLLWVLLLKVPKLFGAPLGVVAWLGFAEIFSLAVGAAMLAALLDPAPRPSWKTAARYAYGICPLIFGLSHFVYLDFTAGMVPGWLPAPFFWAALTGAGHLAAGLAILSGVLSRLAAGMLAAMMGSFALLLHLPRVVADPASQIEWTMLAIATTLAGAAWIVRAGLTPRETSAAASGEMQARPI